MVPVRFPLERISAGNRSILPDGSAAKMRRFFPTRAFISSAVSSRKPHRPRDSISDKYLKSEARCAVSTWPVALAMTVGAAILLHFKFRRRGGFGLILQGQLHQHLLDPLEPVPRQRRADSTLDLPPYQLLDDLVVRVTAP